MKFILTGLALFILLGANAQLEKGTWLVGGSGRLYSYNSELSSSDYENEAKYTQINISASTGFFLKDKLVLGIKPTFSSIKGKVTTIGGLSTNTQRYWIGPFARYYFLEKEKPHNIFADLSYQFGFLNAGGQRGKLRTFSALVGPEFFFNSSVGIELLFGYSYSKEDVELANKEIRKGFNVGFGFQIHLQK